MPACRHHGGAEGRAEDKGALGEGVCGRTPRLHPTSVGNLRVLSWEHHVVRCRAFEFQCAVEGPGGIACEAIELEEHESIDAAHQ